MMASAVRRPGTRLERLRPWTASMVLSRHSGRRSIPVSSISCDDDDVTGSKIPGVIDTVRQCDSDQESGRSHRPTGAHVVGAAHRKHIRHAGMAAPHSDTETLTFLNNTFRTFL